MIMERGGANAWFFWWGVVVFFFWGGGGLCVFPGGGFGLGVLENSITIRIYEAWKNSEQITLCRKALQNILNVDGDSAIEPIVFLEAVFREWHSRKKKWNQISL